MTFQAALAVLPFLLVLTMPGPSQAQRRVDEGLRRRWSVYDYPDPHSLNQDQQSLCGRYNISSVCDPNRIISRTEADAIDSLINEVYTETRCPCAACTSNNRGYIIRVAIMPYFEKLFRNLENTTVNMLRNAQMYSYMLSQKWRMQGACGETVLIMYAREEGMLYTLTRRTARVKLTDSDVSQILMIVRHYFDDQRTVAEGILEMIGRYKMVFQDNSEGALQR